MKLLIVGASALALASPAYALQLPKHSKKDPRVWDFTYDPNDIYKAWSAPGSEVMIRLAPDEEIIKVQAADTLTIHEGHTDHIATLKFQGCVLPEPVFIVSHKTAPDEDRTYTFQFETIPQVCAKDVPAGEQPTADSASVAYTDGVNSSHTLDPLPNLRHLEHPTDLAEGGNIPFLINMKYPGDEWTKRNALAQAAAKHYAKKAIERTLAGAAAGRGPTTNFKNVHYYGRGDASIAPRCIDHPNNICVTDDGTRTTLQFAGHTEVPAISKLGNTAKGCGDAGEEAVKDFSMSGDKMVVPGTAAGWCLRLHSRVYEISNASYNPVGYTTGTGTVSPSVERVVKGAPDGN